MALRNDDDDESSRLLSDSKSTSSPTKSNRRAANHALSLFILAAEFCERFAYYGISSVLTLYMQQLLGFNDATIGMVTNLFVFLAYASVLIGGYVADRSLGR